jgi:hypothetical protein
MAPNHGPPDRGFDDFHAATAVPCHYLHFEGHPRESRIGTVSAGQRHVGDDTSVTTAATRPATARSRATVTALTMAVAEDRQWLTTRRPMRGRLGQ